MKENKGSDKHNDESWDGDAQSGEEALKNEERSLDIGESGQFAPGGYYNQQTIDDPDRTLDDIVPPGRR